MLFSVALLFSLVLAQNFSWVPFPTDGYMHETLYTANKKSIELFWKLNQNDIEFLLASNNGGSYLAMGISETGGMRGSNIWVFRKDESNKFVLETRFAETVGYPKLTETSTLLLQSYQSVEITAFSFKTSINSCDLQKQILDPSVPNIVIFAIGTSNSFVQHAPGNNGNAQVDFSGSFFPDPTSLQQDTFKVNMTSPPVNLAANDTTYCYSLHKFLFEKSHIVMEEVIVGSQYTHHAVAYKCDEIPELEIGKVDCISLNSADQFTRYQQVCSKTWIMWAKGGKSRVFPPNAGKPIGTGPQNTTYFLLEVHYSNPDLVSGIIDPASGFVLTVTKHLRQHDIGMLYLGTLQSFIVLEPGDSRYGIKSLCPGKCTSSFPHEGITPLSFNFHMHGRGRAGITRWIRNGTELKSLANMRYFDFGFQMYKFFRKDHDKILPGDELITTCFWDTSADRKIVMGGLSSKQEMVCLSLTQCTNYLEYYPATDLFLCGQTGSKYVLPNKFLCYGVQAEPLEVDPYLDFKPFVPYPQTCGVNDDGNISNVIDFEWSGGRTGCVSGLWFVFMFLLML